MKLTPLIVVLPLLAMPACDGKDEPTRPDLKGTPKKADQTPDAKTEGAGAKAAPGRVFFVKPADGATVPEQFEVEFGVEGKQVRAAGATERDVGFGHHHLLIDTGPMDDMVIIPKDETHLHYGDGATKATVKLSPGKHRITMQFADGAHRSYGPDWAATISVEVGGTEATDAAAAADDAKAAAGDAKAAAGDAKAAAGDAKSAAEAAKAGLSGG